MEILVCVKQVPDAEDIKIDLEAGTIKDGAASVISPYDKNAVEAAVQLKEKNGGNVTVITMGPDKAKAALKECISVGADRGVLIQDEAFIGSDSYSTSSILAAAIKKLGDFDVIICGNQATDTDAGQVGPQIAELLDMAQITYVNKIEVVDETIVAHRELDDSVEVLEAKFPVLCTVGDSINDPRLATIKTKMAANKAKFDVLTAADLAIDPAMVGQGSFTKVNKSFAPPKRKAGIKIQGSSGNDSAQELLKNLVAAKLI